MTRATILIIDDHPLFRSGVAAVLAAALPGASIREASSLADAFVASPGDGMFDPEIVLLDIQLDGISGLEAIAPLRQRWPDTRIVVVSAFDRPDMVENAMRRGAAGFVSKTDRPERMVALIAQMLRHDAPEGEPAQVPYTQRPTLTPRQTEVLDLLCHGLSNKMIGRRLGLSEHTVRGHVQAVLAVLGASNRGEAAFAARRYGIAR